MFKSIDLVNEMRGKVFNIKTFTENLVLLKKKKYKTKQNKRRKCRS